VSTSAGLALQQVVMLDIGANLVPVCFAFVDQLRELDWTADEDMIKLCQRITLVIDGVLQAMANPQVSRPSAANWTALRQHMEGVAMLWMIHFDFMWRNEIIKVLQLFCQPIFRQIEGAAANVVLLDRLYPGWPSSIPPYSADQFPSELAHVLRNHFEEFEGIASWAWTELKNTVTELADTKETKLHEPQNDMAFQIWHNRFNFLCLALRPARGVDAVVEVKSKKKKKKTAVVVEVNFSQHIPSLIQFKLVPGHVRTFFEAIYAMIHHPDSATFGEKEAKTDGVVVGAPVNPAFYEKIRLVTESVANLHETNLTQLAACLRVACKDDPKFRGNAQKLHAKCSTLFYFHEHTLSIVDRIFFNMSHAFYHRGSDFTKILDQCVAEWTPAIDATDVNYFNTINTRVQDVHLNLFVSAPLPLWSHASSTCAIMMEKNTWTIKTLNVPDPSNISISSCITSSPQIKSSVPVRLAIYLKLHNLLITLAFILINRSIPNKSYLKPCIPLLLLVPCLYSNNAMLLTFYML
jgi:hypothetical protein